MEASDPGETTESVQRQPPINGEVIAADSGRTQQANQMEADVKAVPQAENAGMKVREKTNKKFVDDDSRSPEYRSDEWRMKHFKVIPCSKRYAHDWTICPFAHPGEKARRRDPTVYSYAGIACPEMKKVGMCSRGDQCNYAHNVFEYWMHPARYRTQLCNDGVSCSRHVCFFAHTPEEIRVTPLTKATAAAEKKEGLYDMESSPDGPFTLNAHSLSSTRSSNSGHRSMSLSPEDIRLSPQEMGSRPDFSTARSRSTKSRNDMPNMFSRPVQNNATQDKSDGFAPDMPSEDSPEYQAQVMRAFKALDFNEAQLLLRLARAQVSQQAESLVRRESDTSYMMNRLKNNPDAQLCLRSLDVLPAQQVSPLQTAPAALHFGEQRLPSHGSGYLQPHMLAGEVPPMSNMYNTPIGRQNWQNGLMRRYSNHEASRAPSSNIVPRMSMGDSAHLSGSVFTGPGTGGLYQTSSSTSNKSALHSQPFRLDDVSAQATYTPPSANRQLTAPVPSAFQQLASQEWKSTPGLGLQPQQELNWRYSGGGSMASSDLSRITEDLASTQAQLNLRQNEFNRNLHPPWENRNRSGALQAASNPVDPNFDLLQVPSFGGGNQVQGPAEHLEALRAGPLDLSHLPPLAQEPTRPGLHTPTGPWLNQTGL